MDFYTLTAIKFALGILMMIFQINVLGKRDFSLNTPLNQVQNYVLGGIIGGVIYNSSITLLQFFIIVLIWSLVVIATKILIDYSKTFKRLTACQPELIIRDGLVDIARCAKVGLTAQSLSRSLRDQGISSIRDVETAVMETNGSLTIRLHGDKSRRSLLPLVSDGQFVSDGLVLAGKDAAQGTGVLLGQAGVPRRAGRRKPRSRPLRYLGQSRQAWGAAANGPEGTRWGD